MTEKKLLYSQQLFLQRLTKEHVLSDADAKELFVEIQQICCQEAQSQTQTDLSYDSTMELCIGAINSVIVPMLQLEICTIIIREGTSNVRYHGLVNKLVDDVAKEYAAPSHNVHEVALFRLIIEKIVERGLDEEDENTIGCSGSLSSKEILNLRTELTGAHKGKLSAMQTERALHAFAEEHWLIRRSNRYEFGPR